MSVGAAKKAMRRGTVRVFVLPNYAQPVRFLPGWPGVIFGVMLLAVALFFWRFFSLPAARMIAKGKPIKAKKRSDG